MTCPTAPLTLAIEAAERDPDGGKVMLSLEDAKAIARKVIAAEKLAEALRLTQTDPAFDMSMPHIKAWIDSALTAWEQAQ